ncbi:MAG: NAD(P)H-dependent oxidoreductase [Kangiellaceae bacterium]|nr:NAD(P)H-dependent oxidoreductase [Kangiellaceae bacterium]
MSAKILIFAGSSRKGSFNKKLAKVSYSIAIELGIDATFIDLHDYPMPLYNGDLEEESGLPNNVLNFKKIVTEHDAILIASPEYNGSFSPLLKNTIDWISRPHYPDEPPLSAFQHKITAVVATSPGGLGGMRGLVPLRMLLSNLSTIVIPEQLAISHAANFFDSDGELVDSKHRKSLSNLIKRLVEFC